MKVNAIDLFCGVGGLTCGIQQAGINVVAGIDIEKSCQFAYEVNNDARFIHKDIKDVEFNEINNLYPVDTDIKILIGCAPCQPFSSYARVYKETAQTDKLDLLEYFAKQIQEIKPDIVSMENVPQLVKMPVFQRFLQTLEKNNYKYNWKIVFAPNYGLAQNRKRLLLLASKIGQIEFIPETHAKENFVAVQDVIKDLPQIENGETDVNDIMHKARKLSPLNLKRIRQSKPGGSWRDWDKSLLLECHKKKSGKSFGSVYGRLQWDKPSSTITTFFNGIGNGRFGHPEQDRALSLREGAILQSFPVNYQFVDENVTFSSSQIARQIGNAVPPLLGWVIGKSIMQHLKGLENVK
jgi:DNA (cytosine-5)-methyltransferase 1